MLGVSATGQNTLTRLLGTVRALPHVKRTDLAVSAGVIVVVLAARLVNRRIPGLMIAVIAAIIVSRAADLAGRGVASSARSPGDCRTCDCPPSAGTTPPGCGASWPSASTSSPSPCSRRPQS